MNAEHADLEARFAAPSDRGLPPGRRGRNLHFEGVALARKAPHVVMR